MNHQIVSRYDSSRVLFECDVPADVPSGLAARHTLEKAVAARAYLAGAYLAGANLAGAYLAGAYLAGANLADAYLAGAYLAGAKWRDGIVLTRALLQIHGLHWAITILDQHMQIGCKLHTLADWAVFSDEQIVAMDGRNALRFWRAHKDALLALAASDGRGVPAEAIAQEEAAR